MAEIHRAAKTTGDPVELVDDQGVVVNVLHVPGPMPPEPIDKVRELLAKPPRPSRKHVEQAQRHRDAGMFGELVGLLALVDAIREAAREP